MTPLNLSCQWCRVQNVNMPLYLFTHVFHFIEIGKRSERMDTILKRSCMRMTIGRIRWEMSLIWWDNWKRWQVSNIRSDGIIFLKETGDKHWATNCLHIKTCVSDLFAHWFHFIDIGKKIRACGHDFEEVMHAYDNWKNPRKDVTDLIDQMEALTAVKYSPWRYNILERNRRHTLDN